MHKLFKFSVAGLLLNLSLSSVANADVMTSCVRSESGITICQASESNLNVMNLACKNGKSGQTDCNGDYTDKTKSSLQMKCSTNNGVTSCSGSAGDGSSFAMSCAPYPDKTLKCRIADNLGESLTMTCKMGASGIPDCTGIDNQGAQHRVSCNGRLDESANCKAS